MDIRIKVQDKEYRLCAARIVSRNVRGIPLVLELMDFDQQVNLKDLKDKGEKLEFVTMFLPSKILEGDL